MKKAKNGILSVFHFLAPMSFVTLLSCGMPSNNGACVASLSSSAKQWFNDDRYLGSGGLLETIHYEDASAAFKAKAKPNSELCTSQFQWEGDNLLAFTWQGCIDYGNAISFNARLYVNNGYIEVPLIHSNTEDVKKYMVEARKELKSKIAAMGHGKYLWPQNSFLIAKKVSTKSEITENCYNSPIAPLKNFGCISMLNMKVERFQVDVSALNAKQKQLIELHKSQFSEIRKTSTSAMEEKWQQFSKNHLELADLSIKIRRAEILSDLKNCGTPSESKVPIVALLCKEQKSFLPLAKKHLLIDGKNVWDVADAAVADELIAKPEELVGYYEAQFQKTLKETEVLYKELLVEANANEGSLEIQSNFFTNNKDQNAALAYIGVQKKNPMLKGFQFKIENGVVQTAIDEKASPNLLKCFAHGSTLSIGKTLPLLVITRHECPESRSSAFEPLPESNEPATEPKPVARAPAAPVEPEKPVKPTDVDAGSVKPDKVTPPASLPETKPSQRETTILPKQNEAPVVDGAQRQMVATTETKQKPEPTETEVANTGVRASPCK